MAISNLMKMAENSLNGWKKPCEKEKLLVTIHFSFSHSVLKRLVLQTLKKQGLFGKGLNKTHFHHHTAVFFAQLCFYLFIFMYNRALSPSHSQCFQCFDFESCYCRSNGVTTLPPKPIKYYKM